MNEQPVEETGKIKVRRPKQVSMEDGVIKVDLRRIKQTRRCRSRTKHRCKR